jgi:hypothetical protein
MAAFANVALPYGGALHSARCVVTVSLDLRLGARGFVCHNRDALETVPRHGLDI